jgi:hypothetical protein
MFEELKGKARIHGRTSIHVPLFIVDCNNELIILPLKKPIMNAF